MVVPNTGKREEVLNLIKEKDKIDHQIRELGNVLSSVRIVWKQTKTLNLHSVYNCFIILSFC